MLKVKMLIVDLMKVIPANLWLEISYSYIMFDH